MKTISVVVVSGVIIVAGIGAVLLYKKRQKQQEELAALKAQQLIEKENAEKLAKQQDMAATATFCNPPVAGTGINKSVAVFNYQYAIAVNEWEKQGKGMDPDYFYDQYLKSKCGA